MGKFSDSPYFGNYERWTLQWRMAIGELDGEPVIIRLHRENNEWRPRSVVRLDGMDRHVTRIADYGHCPWVLPAATSVLVGQSFIN